MRPHTYRTNQPTTLHPSSFIGLARIYPDHPQLMQIHFKNEIKELTRDLKLIKDSAIPKATVQALNKTAKGTKTDAKRAVNSVTGITQKDIGEELRVWKATKYKQVAGVNARTGKARNLINFVTEGNRKPNHFNHRRTLKSGRKGKYKAKGVKAKAWRKTKTYDGTFIGKGKGSGKLLVFARTSAKRTPLKPIMGPSIRNTFDSKTIQAKLKSQAEVRFRKDMTAAVRNQIRLAVKARG